jgi:hypothetical protein
VISPASVASHIKKMIVLLQQIAGTLSDILVVFRVIKSGYSNALSSSEGEELIRKIRDEATARAAVEEEY